jgi:hypothetical protein
MNETLLFLDTVIFNATLSLGCVTLFRISTRGLSWGNIC